MSTLKVNTINAATSGQAVDVDIKAPKSFRNLIINGAMQIAQRGTSTSTNGDLCCDRWKCQFEGNDEAPTFAQHALTSSDTGPWEKGFRNSLHVTNGNQTSGAGATDEVNFYYQFEAQDIANSGWDYTSSSSYVSFSFWVKSSVAQNFYGAFTSRDGTNRSYTFQTGTLSANTWTKIEKIIPGSSDIQIDNNTAEGMTLHITPFYGTDYTASGVTLDAWVTKVSSQLFPDNTSTWYTTNDATFEFTGVQLEVGSVPTEFEHRSYQDDLIRCQRYYYCAAKGNSQAMGLGVMQASDEVFTTVRFPVPMRATPSLAATSGTEYYKLLRNNHNDFFTHFDLGGNTCNLVAELTNDDEMSGSASDVGFVRTNNASSHVGFSAEL